MKSTGLLIAAAVLAALTGVLYWSNHHKSRRHDHICDARFATKLVTAKDAEVTKIEIDKKGAEQVALAKGSDGKWEITAPAKADRGSGCR